MTAVSDPTVFVVDDDDLVRASIQGMLKSVGCVPRPSGRRKNSYTAIARTDQAAWFWT